MNIRPISDLRNYNSVLKDCKMDNPVFLTKNGRGKYVLMSAEQYDSILAEFKMLQKIINAEKRINDGEEYMSISDLKDKLGVKNWENLRLIHKYMMI